RRPYEGARVDEPAQLVAREERLLQRRVPRQPEVLCVREHGLDDVLGIALLPEDRRAVLRVLVERRVHLVVEVVEQRGHAPKPLVVRRSAMNAPSRSVVLTIALVIGLIVGAGLAQADDIAWKAAHDTDPHLALTQQQLDATAAKRAAEAPSAAPLIGALAAPWSECG